MKSLQWRSSEVDVHDARIAFGARHLPPVTIYHSHITVIVNGEDIIKRQKKKLTSSCFQQPACTGVWQWS